VNPAAVEWLEALDFDEHMRNFKPAVGLSNSLFTLKFDHETYGGDENICWTCLHSDVVVTIEPGDGW
jgi:hypothetical protein